jgi:probable rRNA maturation factor
VRRLRVSVVDARGRALPTAGLARWLRRVAPAHARGEVAIALVPDARVRALNRQYRRKDSATDVLSFRVESAALLSDASRGPKTPSPRFLGDIVIAKGVAARQARQQGHSLATELRILALHGLLHLLGYDHEMDSGRMSRLERRLRRKGGLKEGLTERSGAGPREHKKAPAAGARRQRGVRRSRTAERQRAGVGPRERK